MSIPISQLVEFTEAALAADYGRLRKVGQQMAREMEVADQDGARRFRLTLNRKGVPLQASGFSEMLPVDSKSRLPLIEEHPWPSVPVFLDANGQEKFEAFITDVNNFDLLASKGIASKLSLMLSGPPGTGKTLLAGHIASQLGRKLYVARLDSVISSMLGDTAKNIRSIFDFIAGKNAVLFLDELDAVAKMRDDRNELGELKRVVNTVIQGVDSLDDRAIVIAATNHAQMLDKAIWRRFHYKIDFDPPDFDLRQALWLHFLGNEEGLGLAVQILANLSEGLSGAEIEQYAFATRRLSVLTGQALNTIALADTIACRGVVQGERASTRSSDVRRNLAHILVKQHHVSQIDVARFLGITRQAVSTYLKGANDAKQQSTHS